MEYYNFNTPEFSGNCDVKSLIHTINLLGDNLTGIELGVHRAQSLCTILHSCPNVNLLYGIDFYQPYMDFLKYENFSDGTPSCKFYQKDVDLNKSIAYNRIQYSGMAEKVIFYEQDSNEAVKSFKEESVDFIFVDTYLTKEQSDLDLKTWYPILKKGGLFSGHDWNSHDIQNSVNSFREQNEITSNLSVFDDCWAWIK